jgi:hypothetical protein
MRKGDEEREIKKFAHIYLRMGSSARLFAQIRNLPLIPPDAAIQANKAKQNDNDKGTRYEGTFRHSPTTASAIVTLL